jgi:cell division control protein 6
MKKNSVSSYQEIFKKRETKIIKDAFALSPNYIPPSLIGRNDEIFQLADSYTPLDYKGFPSNILIYGYAGSGKTVTTKFFLNKLNERIENEPILDHRFKWVYLSCKEKPNILSMLYGILSQIDPYTTVPRSGYSFDFYYNTIWEQIRIQNLSLVIVFDEIDQIKNTDILYNISRAGEEKKLPDRHFISIIGISNDLHYGEELDGRIKSSLNLKDVQFNPYNAENIETILEQRAELAFFEGTVPYETINACAVHSARVFGDARKAIDLLKAAATFSEKLGCLQVLPEHIDKAVNIMEEDRILKFIPQLPFHDKILLLAISKITRDNNPTTDSGKVYDAYCKLCKTLEIKQLHQSSISNKLSWFVTVNLIKNLPAKRGRSGRIIQLSVNSVRSVEKTICEDESLIDLKDVTILLS